MNVSLDKYLDGLEQAVRRLPELLEVSQQDADLRAAYADQYEWLLGMIPDARAMGIAQGRAEEVGARLDAAEAEIARSDFREQLSIKAAMEEASRQVRESPAWLKSIYERNEQLDQHRRRKSK